MSITPTVLFLAGLSLVTLVLAILWAVLVPSNMTRRLRRLTSHANQAADGMPAEDQNPFAHLSARIEALGTRIGWVPSDMGRRLRRAGFANRLTPAVYVMLKVAGPMAVFPLVLAYVNLVLGSRLPELALPTIAAGLSLLVFWAPDLVIKNATLRRQTRIERGWPDALDLLHLCMNAGMGLESALAKVSQEIRPSYPDIADEMMLTTSELTYLQERRLALENLAERTDIRAVREAVTTLVQSERYGTSLGETLQILARQNRAHRLAEAEKKAASLPPKLTVPMILFFLPSLFVVIGAPAIIRLAGLQ